MNLYKILWWHGNLEMKDLVPYLGRFQDITKELDILLGGGKISIHRADFGKVYISCPAFKRENPVEEYIKKNPGCTASEVQDALHLNKQRYYELIKDLEIRGEKDGRKVRLYLESQETVEPVTPVPLPPEEREDRSEPVEEPEDPLMERARELGKYYGGRKGFEFTVEEIYQDLREGTGAVEEWIFERLSDRAQQVIEEFEEYNREDLMERFNLTKMEAINLYNELVASQLVEGLGGGIWKVK